MKRQQEYIQGIVPKGMKIEYRPITEIIPYENNPRLNDDAVPTLSNIISQFKFRVPMLLKSDGTIITGHTRLKALKALNYTGPVPIIIADDMSNEEIDAFRLADNMAAEKSGWDFSKLDIELQDLKDVFNMEDFGFIDYERFDIPYPGEERSEAEIPDEIPNIPEYHGGESNGDDIAIIVHCFNEHDADTVVERMREEGRICRRL